MPQTLRLANARQHEPLIGSWMLQGFAVSCPSREKPVSTYRREDEHSEKVSSPLPLKRETISARADNLTI